MPAAAGSEILPVFPESSPRRSCFSFYNASAAAPPARAPKMASAPIFVTVGESPIMPSAGEKFQQLVAIMARLRAPGGCPWDREQTFDSIKPYTLEETYEVLDAIDR